MAELGFEPRPLTPDSVLLSGLACRVRVGNVWGMLGKVAGVTNLPHFAWDFLSLKLESPVSRGPFALFSCLF